MNINKDRFFTADVLTGVTLPVTVRLWDEWDSRRENWALGVGRTVVAALHGFVAGNRVIIVSFADGTHTHLSPDEEIYAV